MNNPLPNLPTPPADWDSAIQSAGQCAFGYFKKFSHVVFLSSERFWEPHGFVQQSLGYALVNEGIPVTWLDGQGWRRYAPTVSPTHPQLSVHQVRQLPLRRVPRISEASRRWEAAQILAELKKGPAPFFWIWGGGDEALMEKLPAPHVYSVFDNPYGNLPDGLLCQKALRIVCQNSFATSLFLTKQKEKTHRIFPPVPLPQRAPGAKKARTELPAKFPERVLGYVGSHLGEGLDFSLLEQVLGAVPDWGVLLVGRTDALGEEKLKRLTRYPNFHRVPWVPREEALAYWQLIDVALFPYAEVMSQDGAFAVKTLEALYFGKPVLATRVPKTENFSEEPALGLRATARFFSEANELRALLDNSAPIPTASFWKLAELTHPLSHLAQIARLFS